MRLMFAASEVYPAVKTGGLGDVIYSLPRQLHRQGHDVTIVLPAYGSVMEQIPPPERVSQMTLPGAERSHQVNILCDRSQIPGIPLWLVDCPALFSRGGNPYIDGHGRDWADNAERFTLFARAVVALSGGNECLSWRPDVVHCNDWQTGLVPALLSQLPAPPASVFTIHNQAYTGTFDYFQYQKLDLPAQWWNMEQLEFYGNFSMLKAGIVFADRVTTVSPTYAREIQTPEYGHGLDGVLRHFNHKLRGILNGIDTETWDPASDSHLACRYRLGRNHLKGKQSNKAALLAELGLLAESSDIAMPLLGFVGRLVHQKGIDLLLALLPKLIDTTDARFVILGTGEHAYEQQLKALADRYPTRLAARIGYSERLAHGIEAGADLFLMPSRFEPCGLNQLYSLSYGTPPVVHTTGGLADTVTDTNPETLKLGSATGFHFDRATPEAFHHAITRALRLWRQPRAWRQLIRNGMAQEFSWEKSAIHYLALYHDVIEANRIAQSPQERGSP